MSGRTRNKRPWTPRRVFRWIGIVVLMIALFMALIGAYVLKSTISVRFFFVYWTIFFLLLLSAIVLAMFDALATIVKFRKEHTELRKAIRNELHGNRSVNS